MTEAQGHDGALRAAGVALNEHGRFDQQRSGAVRTLPSGVGEANLAAAAALLHAKQKGPQTPEGDLRHWFALHTALTRGVRTKAVEQWHYACTYDLVGREGTSYAPRVLPKRYKMMLPKNCFGNSRTRALRNRKLAYVEGYGLTETGVPAHHAWCLDEHGEVLDTTWPWTDDPQAGYFKTTHGALIGVVIPTPLLALVHNLRRYNGVLEDWEHDFPAFWGPWDPTGQALTDRYEQIVNGPRRDRG